jgi:hypothetical protein
MTRITLSVLGCWLLIVQVTVAGQPAPDKAPPSVPSQEMLEKQFAETMSGATLVGQFTLVGPKGEQPLKEDRYTLGKVSKLKNDFWSFETRIQYGDHDVKLPLALQVKWAGDTPMITLTDVTIPGLGTFTSRVLVYRGHYAGTWSGGDHGGHLFGKIVRENAAAGPAEKSSEEPKKAP